MRGPGERGGEPVCIGAEVGPRWDSGRVPGASLSLCSSPAVGWWPSISAWAPEATRRPGTTISVVHIHLNNAHLHSNCFIGIQLKLTFLPTLNQRAGFQRSGMNGVVLFQLLKVTAFVFVPKSAFQPYLKFQHSSSFSHTWNSNTLPLSRSLLNFPVSLFGIFWVKMKPDSWEDPEKSFCWWETETYKSKVGCPWTSAPTSLLPRT